MLDLHADWAMVQCSAKNISDKKVLNPMALGGFPIQKPSLPGSTHSGLGPTAGGIVLSPQHVQHDHTCPWKT